MGLIVLIASVAQAAQPDWAREKRLDEQVRDAILDGDALDLKAGERSFLVIHMVPEAASKRGVVLMHGRGFHPDWGQVVGPLRVALAEAGFHTLSIQMPVLDKAAKYHDYVPILGYAHSRIDAAIAHLRSAGVTHIALLAHSCSVHMVMDYVLARGDGAFDAFVGVGMGATDYKQPMAQPFPLDKMRVPVLDVFGSADYPAVHRLAPQRLEQMRAAANPASKQLTLDGADHYFSDADDALLDAVLPWLKSLQ
jgi:hypothetical protein